MLTQGGLQGDQVEFSLGADKGQLASIIRCEKRSFQRFRGWDKLVQRFDLCPVKNLVAIGIRIAI